VGGGIWDALFKNRMAPPSIPILIAFTFSLLPFFQMLLQRVVV